MQMFACEIFLRRGIFSGEDTRGFHVCFCFYPPPPVSLHLVTFCFAIELMHAGRNVLGLEVTKDNTTFASPTTITVPEDGSTGIAEEGDSLSGMCVV